MTDNNISAIDERLERALEFSNYRSTLNRQMKLAKIRLDNALSYSLNGGTFKITPELIAFIHALIDMGKTTFILLDIHDKAVDIPDLKAFEDNIMDAYGKALNDYLMECNKLRLARSVKSLSEV